MSNNDSIHDDGNDNDNDDDMLSEFKPKIKAFFTSSNAITSKDDLDKFLDTCGLLEIWNSEEEKNTVWHSLLKYMNHNGNITYDSAIKGLRDLFTETTVNNISSSLLISPTKQNELNMFINTIDNDKYLQLKKISILLDMNNRTHLMQSEIQELLTKHKFIKLNKDDIIEFINVIGDNKTKTKNYEIDNTLYTNAMKQMEAKLTSEQSVLFGDNNINESLIYEDKGDDDDVDAVELIDDIAQKENEVIDIMNVLFGIKNSFYELNNNLINQYERYINGDDDKLSDVDKTQMEIDKKVKEYDLFMKDITKCNKSANHKIEMLKTIVFKQNNKIKVMEDEYRQLYQQFTDNQQLDIDDEMERLIDENVILTRDKEEKNTMIDNLHKVIQSKDNMISSYQIQCDDLNKQKEELKMSIDELTRCNDKLKNEYDILVNNILNKIQKEEEEELITVNKQNDVDVTSINVQTITITELHNTLKQMKSPNLIRFALKVSHDYQTLLNEFNAKSKLIDDISHNIDELKSEVNTLKQTNAQVQNENNVLKNKLDAYKNEAEINNCFRPSTVLGSRLSRMSRLSRLESAGTKNLFSPSSFSNVSSAAFFSGQKQRHTTNSLTTPFEYGDKVKCSASKVNATAQKANAVNMKGNIDEIQEGNEDDEEDKEKSLKGGTKNKNEGDEDTGEWELMTNIRNVPIEKGKGSSKKVRVNLNKLIIGNVFNSGNDESINNANNIPKTMRDKSLKSFEFNSGMESSGVNVDNSGNDSSVQVQSSITDGNNSEVRLTSNDKQRKVLNVKSTPTNKSLDNEGMDSKSLCSLQSQDNFTHNTHSSLEQAIENANINEIEITPSNKSIPPIQQIQNESTSIIEELKHKTPSKKRNIHIKSSLVPNKNHTSKNDSSTSILKETQHQLNIIKTKIHLSTILEKHNDTTTEDKLFNDYVFDIECDDHKVKTTLILTPNGIYLLNSDDYSEKQYHQCNSLTTIILSTKNPNIIAFYFEKDNEDLCIETIRRFEILYYIRNNIICRSACHKLPIRYEDNIIISKHSKQFNIDVTGKLFIDTINFECAHKYGYLYKYNTNSNVSTFTEKLIVLTNIGLLCYDYINKPPTLLIPIIGSNILIIHDDDSKYKMSNVFEIKTNMGESFIFSAYSDMERGSWINELKRVQKIYDDKKKAIDTLILQNEDDT